MPEDDPSLSNYLELHKSAWMEKAAQQDYELRRRKQELDELDYKLREKQFEHTKTEGRYSKWVNPLIVAVTIGLLTLIGNIIVQRHQAQSALEQAKAKSLSDVLISLIKTGNREDADSNLLFYYNLHLLEDKSGHLGTYLTAKREAAEKKAAEDAKKAQKPLESTRSLSIDKGPVLPAAIANNTPIGPQRSFAFSPAQYLTGQRDAEGHASWSIRWVAPGPVTDASLDPDPTWQHSFPCTIQGKTAECSGWINGGNAFRVMTVHWSAN